MDEEQKSSQSSKPVMLVPGHPVAQGYWRGLSEHYDLCFMYPQALEYAASLNLRCLSLIQFQNGDTQEHALNAAAQTVAKAVQNARVIAGRLISSLDGSAPQEFHSAVDWWPGYVMQHAQALASESALLTQLSNVREIAGCVVHEDVAPESRCDWILASGEYERDFYSASGHPLERIVIVGAPQMDGLYADEAMPNRDEARRVLDIDNDRVICYAGTWSQTTAIRGSGTAETDDGLRAVIELVHEWKAVLIIKSHPNGGDDKAFENALRSTNTPGLITKHYISYAVFCLKKKKKTT